MTVTGQAIFEAEYVSYANKMHGDQKYGNQPYLHHLVDVVNILEDFGFTEYKFQAAGYLHDVLEDTEATSGDLIRGFGTEVAEIVIACTGEGSTRSERQSNILHKLRYCPDACIVKLADRIANVEMGLKEENFEKLEMYYNEYGDFSDVVRPHVPSDMLDRLTRAFELYNERRK